MKFLKNSHKRFLSISSFVVAVFIAFKTQQEGLVSLFLGFSAYQSGATVYEKKYLKNEK